MEAEPRGESTRGLAPTFPLSQDTENVGVGREGGPRAPRYGLGLRMGGAWGDR